MVVSDLFESIVDMPGEFADVAAQGPIEGTLVLFGALFVIVPSIALGVLTVGAVVELVTPDSVAVTHP